MLLSLALPCSALLSHGGVIPALGGRGGGRAGGLSTLLDAISGRITGLGARVITLEPAWGLDIRRFSPRNRGVGGGWFLVLRLKPSVFTYLGEGWEQLRV